MNQAEIPNFQIVTKTDSYIVKIPYSKTRVLWIGLALACMLLFGDAYAFDNPMALQSTIQQELNINNIQFNMLYSIYSLPNIILPFFGGMLIDRMGVRVAIIIFSSIIIFGQGIVVIGGYTLAYSTMLTGRGIFGTGSESLNAAQAAIMSHWFAGGQVSLALGLCLSIPKLGSAMNSFVSPLVQEKYGSLGFTLLIGLIIVIISWLCGIVLVLLDRENERRLKLYQQFNAKSDKSIAQQSRDAPDINTIQLENELEQMIIEASKSDSTVTDNSNSSDSQFELQAQLLNQSLLEIKKQEQEDQQSEVADEQVEEIKITDIKDLDGTYWILACIIMLSEAMFVPFLDNGNAFMQVKFGFSQSSAGAVLTIPYVFAALLTPIVGYYSDIIRNRSLLIVFTSGVFIITHLQLLLISCESACVVSSLPLFSLGICYSLYSAILIPTIPLVVKQKMMGTAFGLVGVLQNTALAIFPLITGHIYNSHLLNQQGIPDPKQGYVYQSYFFVGVSFITMIISIGLYLFDQNGSKKLRVMRK